MRSISYPTDLHKRATEVTRDFFSGQEHVDTVLLVNSIARGKATADSDIDIAVLVAEATDVEAIRVLENKWLAYSDTEPNIKKYTQSNRFAQIHLDIISGDFQHTIWEVGGINDYYEIEIGNRLVYSAPLTTEGGYFKFLKSHFLPYYNEDLRTSRLRMVKEAFAYDIAHISVLVKRQLYFHAFDILFKAFQEFMQVLFIENRTYPIAYNKWIKEQVTDILQMPGLYRQLPPIISVSNIESNELIEKAKMLSLLLNEISPG